VLIKGGDYTRDRVVGAELVEARRGRVVLVDVVTGHSTSNLVRAAHSRASAPPRVERPRRARSSDLGHR